MSCERFERSLIDHACGAPIPNAAAAHVAGCSACQARLDRERQLVEQVEQAIRRDLRITASPGFSARVAAHVRALPPAGARSGTWWIAAAACAALAVGMYWSFDLERNVAIPTPAVQVTSPTVAAAPFQPAVTTRGIDPPGTGVAAALQSPEPRRAAQTVAVTAGSVDARPVEVIVPPTQLRAIARLRELVDSGGIDGEVLPPEFPLSLPPAQLLIAPLAVPEIIIPDVEIVTGATAVLRTPDIKESL